MFFHNLKYVIKTLFKNKMLIFWTYAFPIILGTFFYLAFSDIEKKEKLDVINIALVLKNNNDFLKESLEKLSDKDYEDRLFNIKYTDEKTAKNNLENNKIEGYLVSENGTYDIFIKENSINTTIFKSVIEEIYSNSNIITDKIKNDKIIDLSFIKELSSNKVNIKNISKENLSYTMIEFYTLIAMSCLYGGILGMVCINNLLPNMTSIGKRINVSPARKFKLILSSVIGSYLVQIIGLFLLFIYTIFVLKVDYGNNLSLVLLLSLLGSLAGLSLGIFVSTIFKTSDNAKTGILISLTMLGCFLSGMMGITMKYAVDKNIPIINKINPANMITDGFYSLYYYSGTSRYKFNILSLLIFSCLMIILSFNSLRRQKYDSI